MFWLMNEIYVLCVEEFYFFFFVSGYFFVEYYLSVLNLLLFECFIIFVEVWNIKGLF